MNALSLGIRSGSPPRRADRFNAMAWLVALCVSLAMLAVLVRVAQLQIAPSEDLREHFEPRVTHRTELDLRGDIRDSRNRLLSVTRFGYRVVVDPTLLPEDIDTAIVKLADAMSLPTDAVGARIIRAMMENEARAAAAAAASDSSQLPARKPITSRFISLAKEKLIPIAGLEEGEAVGPPAEPVPGKARGPIRYLVVSGLLNEQQVEAVKALKMSGVTLEKRQVREYPGGPEIAPIVGKVSFEHKGLLGAEKLLDDKLEGRDGKISFVRDARGNPIWIEPGQIIPAMPGGDVRLSLDLEVQRIAHEELQRGIEEADAAGGRCVVVDSITGEVLAMVDLLRTPPDAEPFPWADDPPTPPVKKGQRPPAKPPAPPFPEGRHRWLVNPPDPAREVHPALARNRNVEDMYEPGSTFKPFVWATITELGLAGLDEVFETGRHGWVPPDGRKPIRDVTARDTMTWREVLINSSNIGMIKGAQRLTHAQLHDAVVRFGFGKPTGIGLPFESGGRVTALKDWKKSTQVSVAFGNEIAVTPVQMVRAFCAFARPGELGGTLPRLRLTAGSSEGPGVTYRVLPAWVAKETRETMAQVAAVMEAKYCKPPEGQRWRYVMFGKSGTAKIPVGAPPKGKRKMRGAPSGYLDQYRSSFIAGAPLENPRLVVLVVIDDPGPERIRKATHYGSAVAGPVVRRVVERTLTYLGTPPSPIPAD
jgi:cell division protein FtsI (penicillin-binding protein 3)